MVHEVAADAVEFDRAFDAVTRQFPARTDPRAHEQSRCVVRPGGDDDAGRADDLATRQLHAGDAVPLEHDALHEATGAQREFAAPTRGSDVREQRALPLAVADVPRHRAGTERPGAIEIVDVWVTELLTRRREELF